MHYDLTGTYESLQEALYPVGRTQKLEKRGAEEVRHPILFGLFSALIAAISVFGLFAGALFRGAPLGQIVAGGEPVLRGSLFGLLVEIVRGSVKAPASGLPLLLYALVICLAAAILLAFACTAAAFLVPKRARTFALAGAYPVTLIYGALFLVTLLHAANGAAGWSDSLFDLPTLTAFLLLSAALALPALIKRRGRAVLNLLFLLLSLSCVPALCYPQTPICEKIGLLFSGGDLPAGTRLLFALLLALSALNIALSLLRLGAGNSCLWDMLRFGLQLIPSLALLFTELTADGIAEFFFAQPLPVALLFLPPLAAAVLAAFGASAPARATPKEPESEPPKPEPKPESASPKPESKTTPEPKPESEPEPSEPRG